MPIKLIREFIKLESSAGIILFMTAVLAIIIDNTRLSPLYENFFRMVISISIGEFQLSKPLLNWINDGFMSLFFMLVGLEVKREILEGELNSVRKAMLPAITAAGGMLVPSVIYIFLNHHDSFAVKGWAIPTPTDIAFSLGILSLLGSRIPVSLKIFLTAFAIFDDIGAILVIAAYYTSHISLLMLLSSAVLVLLLILFNRRGVRNISVYVVTGIILWICVLKSGVHATLAGIIIALTIPLKESGSNAYSPLRILEHKLHPWVAYGILPLFAFANAGVSFYGVTLKDFFSPISLGIALGLFVGKQLGIWATTIVAVTCRVGSMPKGMTPLNLYGISLIAGIGFTMSLFIGGLAFGGQFSALVRLGVIVGSFLSGTLGYLVLSSIHPKSHSTPKVV